MSQDLFAAFGSPPTGSADSYEHEDAHDNQALRPAEEDDDFGEFEDAAEVDSSAAHKATDRPTVSLKKSPIPPKPPGYPLPGKEVTNDDKVGSHPFAGRMDLLFGDEDDDDEYHAGSDEITDLANNPEAAMAYSKRVIAEQQAEQERRKGPLVAPAEAPPQRHEPKKLKKKSGYMPAQNADVLFDAEAEAKAQEAEDEFDDFVGFEPTAIPPTSGHAEVNGAANSLDLLALDDQAPKPGVLMDSVRAPQSAPGASTASKFNDQAAEDDAWDDFEVSSTTAQPSAITAPSDHGIGDSPFQRSTSALTAKPSKAVASAESLPPTNVPPPAVLFSVFPSIFTSGDEALLGPLGRLDFKQKQVLLAHPATHMFLRGYLSLAVVLGHIIAGRKLRWKRDHRLAQSMKIGPAAAGGKGGMKLAGIDKGEVAKEDREALDALRVWKVQAGKLRSAVTTASASTPVGQAKMPAFPELSEQMPVRVVKMVEGGVTAPQPCALCGLKREERVAKVDVEVNDSFGEWWVDGTNMHLLCKNFWEEHKGKLKSR